MENAPSIPLATPTSPGNALIGIRIPFTSSNHANFSSLFIFHILSAGSGYSSARSPKPGMRPVQPQSAVSISRISTCRVFPGSASAMCTGPQTWSSCENTRDDSVEVVEMAVIWPFDASRQSKETVSPDFILTTGGILEIFRSKNVSCAGRHECISNRPVVPSKVILRSFHRVDRHRRMRRKSLVALCSILSNVKVC